MSDGIFVDHNGKQLTINIQEGSTYVIVDSNGTQIPFDTATAGGAGTFTSINVSGNGNIDGDLTVGGTITAAGSDTQVQFNDSGVLAGSADLTWDGSVLTVAGTIADSDSAANAGHVRFNHAGVLSSSNGFKYGFDTGVLQIGEADFAAPGTLIIGNGVGSGSGDNAATLVGNSLGDLTITPGTSSVTIAGNLVLSGTARRIQGDFSNATVANRTIFQSSTTNGNTSVRFMPNGSGTGASTTVINTSDPANSSYGTLTVSSSVVQLSSDAVGTGTHLPLQITTQGGVVAEFSTTGNSSIGIGGLATTATDGFVYIPACAGTPTGVPTTVAGYAPMVVDSTNNKLYVYTGGAWVAMN